MDVSILASSAFGIRCSVLGEYGPETSVPSALGASSLAELKAPLTLTVQKCMGTECINLLS